MERRAHRQVVADRVVRLVLVCAVLGVLLVLVAAPLAWVLEQAGDAMRQVMD